MRALRFLSLLLLAAPSCGLPLSESSPRVENRCDGDDACGPSGSCISGSCVANEASLDGLLITVQIPAQFGYGGDSKHVIAGTDLPIPLQGVRETGFFVPVDLVTTAMAEVTAELALSSTECAALRTIGAYPLELELTPVGHPVGLGLTGYSGASTSDETVAKALVPAGRYDIYLTAAVDDLMQSEQGCSEPPPFILYDRAIPAGSAPLVLAPPNVISVTGSILGYDATGWTAQLVENGRGRPVSSRDESLAYDDAAATSAFEIESYAEVLFSETKSAILKLTPPPTSEGLPTVLVDALAAFNGDTANGVYTLEVNLAELAKPENQPQPIELVVFSDSDSGVPATLTLQAKTLFNGAFGGNLVYKRTLDTDANGKVTTPLVPGVYEIVAQPLHDDFAITTVEKTINASTLGSISLQLAESRVLEGSATTPLGAPAFGIGVLLQPPPPAPATYLQNQLSTIDLKLGGGATVTDDDGFFSLTVDPGEYDLVLRPEPTTNLPWRLVPRLAIPSAGTPIEPVAVALSHPVVLTGQARASSGDILPGAIVRAFLPATAEKNSVVQIAETSVAGDGSYRLLLPGK